MSEDILEFKHVFQGDDTRLCGQACVASVLGITLDAAIRLMGCKGRTTAKDLAEALGVESKRRRGRWTDPFLLFHNSFSIKRPLRGIIRALQAYFSGSKTILALSEKSSSSLDTIAAPLSILVSPWI